MYPESAHTVLMFLLPFWREPVQIFFFWLLFTMVFFCIFAVRLCARPESWEKRWQAHTEPHTNLGTDSYTLTDLSLAVATPAEKLARILPCISLALGLLGTTLNIGIMLGATADMLYRESSIDYVPSPLYENMIGAVITGLHRTGSAFCILAWGIIAFLGLHVWLAFNQHEARRMAWCGERRLKN